MIHIFYLFTLDTLRKFCSIQIVFSEKNNTFSHFSIRNIRLYIFRNVVLAEKHFLKQFLWDVFPIIRSYS